MDTLTFEKNNIICHGCLSVDRLLSPIKKYMEIYLMLLGNNPYFSGDVKGNVYMCFECVSLLRKVVMFKQRIRTAQDMLSKMLLNWTPKQSLSHLTVTKNDDYNMMCMESDNETERKIKIEYDSSCHNYDNGVKEEMDMFDYDQNVEENLNDVNIERESRIVRNLSGKCKISDTSYTPEEKEGLVVPVTMKLNDVLEMPKKKNGVHYKNMMAVCSRYIGSLAEVRRRDLLKKPRPQGLKCSDCGTHVSDQTDMQTHWNGHRVLLNRCRLCETISRGRKDIINHISDVHTRMYTCNVCGMQCWRMQEFNRHFRSLHKYFICDLCGRKFYSKSVMERHIRCRHLRCRPPGPPEPAYCVECDRKFPTRQLYRRHLRTAAAHRPPAQTNKVPCPDCGKTFSRKVYMNNHHKQVHRRDSPHYCRVCDKYFINGYAIRTHVKFVHEKSEKPKNKICDICHRGFHTNRVLTNHRRTHTGERPYCCSHCGAAFAQLQARNTHERTQHRPQ